MFEQLVHLDDDALENPSRRKFLQRTGTVAGAVAFGGVAAATEMLPKGDGDREAHTEKEISGDERVEQKKTPQEQVEQMITNIKEQYGITVEMPLDAAMADRHLSSITKISETVFSDDYLYDTYVKHMSDSERALFDHARNVWTLASEDTKKDILANGFDKRGVRGTDLTENEKEDILESLENQLALYPRDMIRTISHNELKIVFSENTSKQQSGAHHKPPFRQKRATTTNPVENVSGLSTGYADDARIDIELDVHEYPAEYKRAPNRILQKMPQRQKRIINDAKRSISVSSNVLHHELFHRIDSLLYLERNNVGKIIDNTNIRDWRTMNTDGGGDSYSDEPFDFHRESKGDNHGFYTTVSERIFHERPYARQHPAEDRAEIAAMLMEGDQHNKLFKQAQNDQVIDEKIRIIQDDFWHLSSGIMDKEYWSVMATGDHEKVRQYVQDKENGING